MIKFIPLEVIDQIGRHCPRAISTFAICAGHSDHECKAVLHRKQITEDLSESFCKFRNDLQALAREGLLEWHQMGEYLHVTIVDFDVPEF